MEEEKGEKEHEELDWDADLEEAQDYCPRVPAPMKRPRQPPKVLMFQTHKCPAGWPAGVLPESLSKPNLILRNMYEDKEDQEQECEYLEPGQRHIYMEPTLREDLKTKPKIPVAQISTEQPELEIENAYKQIKGMEELE